MPCNDAHREGDELVREAACEATEKGVSEGWGGTENEVSEGA